MQKGWRWKWATCVALILVLLALPLTVARTMVDLVFDKRYSSLELPTLKTIDAFPHLLRAQMGFLSQQGNRLSACLYTGEKTQRENGLIVFAHGFGYGGHSAYLPLIDALVQRGFAVFAYDATGCDSSEGEQVRGLCQGICDLKSALEFVKAQERFSNMPLYLLGHSWGAYAVCAVLQEEADVTAAAALSGFDNTADMVRFAGEKEFGAITTVLWPYAMAIERQMYPKEAQMSSLQGLRHAQMPVLVMHSTDDTTVPYAQSFARYQAQLAHNPRIRMETLYGKGHMVMLTARANAYNEQKREELQKQLYACLPEQRESMQACLYEQLDKERSNEVDVVLVDRIAAFFRQGSIQEVYRQGAAQR